MYESLLRERVWPRDPLATLEAIVDAWAHSHDTRELTEAARRVLVPRQLERAGTGRLESLVIAPECENELTAWLVDGALSPNPALAVHVRDAFAAFAAGDRKAAVVCSSALRPAIAEFARRFGFTFDVYSYVELPRCVEVYPVSVLDVPGAKAMAEAV